MNTRFKRFLKPLLAQFRSVSVRVQWVKRDEKAWLSQIFLGESIRPQKTGDSRRIERIAQETNKLGAQTLWEGYAGNNSRGPTRFPDDVRTRPAMGDLFIHLVRERKPEIIVEFGTAFGVSGMYFLAGLNAHHQGRLLTFEPNEAWAKVAARNLSQISNRFELTVGTFEANIDEVLTHGQTIDLAFIDAIHTKEFVVPQLDKVVARSGSNSIIVLDDINFSDDMKECWRVVSTDRRFVASAVVGRVGVLELK